MHWLNLFSTGLFILVDANTIRLPSGARTRGIAQKWPV
jgi:hypothetical protein